MKKSYLGILTSILFALVVLTIPALAVSDRASDQISGYYMVATPLQNGQIAIDFGVDATGKMTRLGADSIVVYEKEGSRWETVASWDRYDAGMSSTNKNTYSNTLFFDGTKSREYKITITIFAQDASGTDYRSDQFLITAK